MARLEPLPREELAEFEAFFSKIESVMGFLPNSLLVMARWPELLQGFSGLANVMSTGKLPQELRMLVGFMASNAAGCRYCQAHTLHAAAAEGVSREKLQALFEFESSALFSVSERAALRVAARAAMVPNAVEDEDFDALHDNFTEEEIVEIVAHISLFGWLNRWNDTFATQLEAVPSGLAEKILGERDGPEH
ncbi:MAG: carboxymuconolactone decarboxylase family protein [Halioglobus sp.]|nr:carboxymuconolactone decarboxylase family protein [Halioglobus sp.]